MSCDDALMQLKQLTAMGEPVFNGDKIEKIDKGIQTCYDSEDKENHVKM